MEIIVKVDQISKSFDGRSLVLSDVNLDVHKGQIFGLIGPSGSGKTTLVKLIVGMETTKLGKIEVLKTPIPNLRILQNIGYMAQADALYSDLTGEENLDFFASLFGLHKNRKKKRIAYTAELVNLSNELKKKVGAYSGGMKRRLSLAVALIQDPKVLVLDEPTVGIDPQLRQNIWRELTRLKNQEDKTIIVTTHSMGEAEKCDFLAMLREGRVIANGTANELKENYKVKTLEEVFLKAGEN